MSCPAKRFLVLLTAAWVAGLSAAAGAAVVVERLPEGALQPQVVVDGQGTAHLVFLKGEPSACDVFYSRRAAEQTSFSRPVQVNSQPNSAIATGTIRGAQLAVGKNGRVHVVWNGSGLAEPKPPRGVPLLYARLNGAGTAFEPQRNLITWAGDLDGGGSIAADAEGNVFVMWHGRVSEDTPGEAGRAVVVARSHDAGRTFTRESRATEEPTGACGCCGMRAFADGQGTLYALFRGAARETDRDMHLLVSRDHGQSFRLATLARWKLAACPMSSAWLTESAGRVLAAWESGAKVWFATVDPAAPGTAGKPIAAPSSDKCKHPVVLGNARGEVLFVWTEGTGWAKGGRVAWQVYDPRGQPADTPGRAEGLPAWSYAAAFARPDGDFVILY